MDKSKENQYFFIFGNNPALSVVELGVIFDKNNILWRIISLYRNVLIAEVDERVEKIFPILGGCIKYGKLFHKMITTVSLLEEEIVRICKDAFLEGENLARGKHFFGLSDYASEAQNILPQIEIKRLGVGVKRKLREAGLSVRWVESREEALSSVVVRTNRLLTASGKEIVIVFHDGAWRIGETLDVQAFAEFSERDYGRPGRDSASGMLPPKLARMMINMALGFSDFCAQKLDSPPVGGDRQYPPTTHEQERADSAYLKQFELAKIRKPSLEEGDHCGAVILDPFCGSGTVIQEAVLMGYRAIGSDMSEKAVADSQENMQWLLSKFQISNSKFQIFLHDARTLSRLWQEKKMEMVDAIVTEPYLGPQKEKDLHDLPRVVDELSVLYRAAFHEFAHFVKSGGRVVFIFPFFVLSRGVMTFFPNSLIEDIERSGFLLVHLKKFVLKYLSGRDSATLAKISAFTERGSVLYRRPDQRVGREIVVFEKI